MAYEIAGETIKSAISIKLKQIFNNPKRYKENITKQEYPNFHIVQVSLTLVSAGLRTQRTVGIKNNRIQLDYLINIQYRVAKNTETVNNLQQQLDEVGLILCAEFNEIDLELPVKIKNKNYEKVDGVGQFTCNITIFANIEEEETPKMNDLNLDEELKIKEE